MAAGTSHDPIALSEGPASSPEPAQDDDVDLTQPLTRPARSLNPLIAKYFVLKFSGVLPPLGKTRCLRSTRRSLYDSDDGAGSSASAKKSKRHKSRASSIPDSHRKSKQHKKNKKHHSKASSAHLDQVSPSTPVEPVSVRPSSSSSVPPSSLVTAASAANLTARSPPATLLAALRLPWSRYGPGRLGFPDDGSDGSPA
ncbi:hypothetical protein JG688_00013251 [Phytophthora aleatoria]|uniref:Uncharacterized protein n=1 Tax=Phytophthora aleatoria TaxID=2496075 RepID=A0A8J5J133_9STRA|nr:hypothetical protein JG688_00013251 [Phytophthora aleatoria]